MKRLRRIAKLVLLVIGWLLLTANALVFNNTTGWGLFLFYSGFLLVTLLSAGPSLKRVQLKTASVHYGQSGQVFTLPVEIKARRFWLPFFQVSLREDYAQGQQFFFYHGQKLQLHFPLVLNQRGRFEKPPLLLSGGDLFGMILKEQTCQLPSTLYVLPKEDPQGKKLGRKVQQQLTNQLFGEVLPQIKGYREYRFGDNRRQVDWKISARQRSLTIREQEVGQEIRPLLLFWGQEGPDFEVALSRYYSMQKELPLGTPQYLLGQTVQLVETERLFAEFTGFTEVPTTPTWKNQDLLVFYPKMDAQLQGKITDWRKQNRVTLYPLMENEPSASSSAHHGKQVSP